MKNLEVVIEIPKDSAIKYEYDRKTKKIHVDRILRNGDKYPTNYGFVPNTLDWDGDELDVLLISDHQFIPGSSLQARIIGAMKMIDEGETDTKLIGVHADDFALNNIKDLNDLPKGELDKIKHFFLTYKKHKGENVIQIRGFEDYEYAIKELEECINLMKEYGHMPKDEFILKMKKQHPDKYI